MRRIAPIECIRRQWPTYLLCLDSRTPVFPLGPVRGVLERDAHFDQSVPDLIGKGELAFLPQRGPCFDEQFDERAGLVRIELIPRQREATSGRTKGAQRRAREQPQRLGAIPNTDDIVSKKDRRT